MPELSSAAANPPPASRTEAPDVPEVRLRDVIWRGGIDPYRVNMAIAGAIVAAFSASCVIRILRERRVKQTFDRGYQVKHRPSLN